MKALSIGEVLWDTFAEGEYLGGAALNVCANLHRFGDRTLLLSAVGEDARGHAALHAMQELGLSTELIQTVSGLATGTATVQEDSKEQPVFSIERPAAFDAIDFDRETLTRIKEFSPDWLYMGTLLQTDPSLERSIQHLREQLPGVRCFYDMNLRVGHWNLSLVERLCASACILKLNEVEAERLALLSGITRENFSVESFCSAWAFRFGIEVICVTLGPEGCCIYTQGKAERFPGYAVEVNDTVGAGDAFAAAFLHGYDRKWPIARCASVANALGALLASRPGATPPWHMEEVEALVAHRKPVASRREEQ